MTLRDIAQSAGVSVSTVSRVIHHCPQVSLQTADKVRRAMARLDYEPARRARPAASGQRSSARPLAATLLVIGDAGHDSGSGFERLLRGASSWATDCGLHLSLRFVPPEVKDAAVWATRLDGLLLHGDPPGLELETVLRDIPAVWLMANRDRPAWGDQVLPDNTAIGGLAADYLSERGHRHVAFCSFGWESWSMEVRSRSFCRSAEAGGAHAISLEHHFPRQGPGSELRDAAACLVDQLIEQPIRPTGLFIAEDRQAPPICDALRRRGLEIGPGRDIELISCNNEPSHLIGMTPTPVTIDIRAEEIGRRGVERLLWRLRHPGQTGRVRTLIEPTLVAAGSPRQANAPFLRPGLSLAN